MITPIYQRLRVIFNSIFGDSNVRSFRKHNKNIFKRGAAYSARKSIVLFEFNGMHSSHIAFSYLANILALKYHARIVAYFPRIRSSLSAKLIFLAQKLIGNNIVGVYKSFGTSNFLEIHVSKDQKVRATMLLAEVNARIQSKKDVEELAIEGIWIGDLIYDSYLMECRVPTINIREEAFQKFLLQSLELFIFWLDYFERNDVQAVNVTHCVYTLAIPLRIAIVRAIPAYQIGITHAYQLQKNKLFAYNDFFEFREIFSELPLTQKKLGVLEAERRINRRFAGEVGVDMSYSSKSAYGAIQYPRLLVDSKNQKILVATHCFFDSPHSYGNNLFPDFWDWLDFLGQISEIAQYDWYIKTHPDYLPGTKEVIEFFIKKYPKFKLLPSDASHHQIIAEGINVVLTVYGTIGFEYAALGIPVINASRNNPHIAYDFNVHPSSIEEYRQILMDIANVKINIDKQQIFEYYYMKNIYNTEDIFLDGYEKILEDIGGYNAQFSSLMYKTWVDSFTPKRHQTIISGLKYFINSGDFRMGYQHCKNLESKAPLGVNHK